MTAVAVSDVAAKCGNLDHIALGGDVTSYVSTGFCGNVFLRRRHEHYAELHADGVGFWKDAHDLIGGRVGRDVVIGGLAAEQQIAYTPSDEIRFVTALPQGADDRDGKVFEHGSRDALQQIIYCLCLTPTSWGLKAPATRPQRPWCARASRSLRTLCSRRSPRISLMAESCPNWPLGSICAQSCRSSARRWPMLDRLISLSMRLP